MGPLERDIFVRVSVSYLLTHRCEQNCQQSAGTHSPRDQAAHPRRRSIPPQPIGPQPRCGQAAPHRWHRVVDQTLSEHRAAEGPADESCHHRLSQCRATLSANQMCENSGHHQWTIGTSPRLSKTHRTTMCKIRSALGHTLCGHVDDLPVAPDAGNRNQNTGNALGSAPESSSLSA